MFTPLLVVASSIPLDELEEGAPVSSYDQAFSTVICGHSHYAEDMVMDGIRFINTGAWTEKPVFCARVEEGAKAGEDLLESREQVGDGVRADVSGLELRHHLAPERLRELVAPVDLGKEGIVAAGDLCAALDEVARNNSPSELIEVRSLPAVVVVFRVSTK